VVVDAELVHVLLANAEFDGRSRIKYFCFALARARTLLGGRAAANKRSSHAGDLTGFVGLASGRGEVLRASLFQQG